jgi:hypothetical protein
MRGQEPRTSRSTCVPVRDDAAPHYDRIVSAGARINKQPRENLVL